MTGILPKAFSQVATSQICNFPSGNSLKARLGPLRCLRARGGERCGLLVTAVVIYKKTCLIIKKYRSPKTTHCPSSTLKLVTCILQLVLPGSCSSIDLVLPNSCCSIELVLPGSCYSIDLVLPGSCYSIELVLPGSCSSIDLAAVAV